MSPVHDVDFLAFRHLRDRTGLFVDIGANRGQSALSYRAVCPDAPIVSFEANPAMHAQLAGLGLDRFTFHLVAISNYTGQITLHVPRQNEVDYLEECTTSIELYYGKPWIQARTEARGGTLHLTPVDVPSATLDSFDLRPDVIKIDVEGAELAAVEGARETITRYHPVLLIENGDWSSVTEFLAAFGYRCTMYDPANDTIVPLRGETTNSIYVCDPWPFTTPQC